MSLESLLKQGANIFILINFQHSGISKTNVSDKISKCATIVITVCT